MASPLTVYSLDPETGEVVAGPVTTSDPKDIDALGGLAAYNAIFGHVTIIASSETSLSGIVKDI